MFTFLNKWFDGLEEPWRIVFFLAVMLGVLILLNFTTYHPLIRMSGLIFMLIWATTRIHWK